MDNLDVKTGIKTRLIGIVLVFIGILDSMLSWRGGFAASEWYVILIALGLFVYAIGAIRGAEARPSRSSKSSTVGTATLFGFLLPDRRRRGAMTPRDGAKNSG
jgi:hypothetical protein